MQFFKIFFLTPFFLLANSGAMATSQVVGGVRVEDNITIYNNTLVLNGAGSFSNGKNQLYVLQIFAKQKFKNVQELMDAPGPKRIILTPTRDVDTAPIVKMFNRSVEETATRGDMAKLVPGLMSIGNIFKVNATLRPGEVMTIDWVPLSGLIIYVGGKLQGEPQRQSELFRAAAGVWIGDNPADAKLKEALLGQI